MLGWSIKETLRAPIPLIVLAHEGKWDFVNRSNPFGSSKKTDKKAVDKEKRLQSFRSKLSLMKLEARQRHQEKQRG